MTPLERAARALFDRDPLTVDVFRRDCENPDDLGTSRTDAVRWEDLGQSDRQAYMADARAVIDAIREPSQAMVLSVDEAANGHGDYIFRTMIDAMMKEGSGAQ